MSTLEHLIATLERRNASEQLLPVPSVRRSLRVAAGATQAEIAAACGVSRQSVWAWEHGVKNPADDRRHRYLSVLGELALLTSTREI